MEETYLVSIAGEFSMLSLHFSIVHRMQQKRYSRQIKFCPHFYRCDCRVLVGEIDIMNGNKLLIVVLVLCPIN